ncbi:MAG TPA: family 43 glycosylhydrolase [Sunxiuqinia sp.]|nr:family 43 glycosylhydrolase [Sunxiuqinia sp.]
MSRKHTLSGGISLLLFVLLGVGSIDAQTLKLRFDPGTNDLNSNTVADASGNGHDGALLNGAQIASFDNTKVIDLGATNGYIDLGPDFGNAVSELNDYSVYCKLYIPTTSRITGYGNFVWTFSNSNNIATDSNGCLFFSANICRYAISPTKWDEESGVQTGSALQKGSWQTVTYVQKNGTGYLYLNGVLAASGAIAMTPSQLGKTAYNYLGRSCYSGDDYLANAKFADFRVYDGALSVGQVEHLSGMKSSSVSADLMAGFNFDSTSDSQGNYTGSLRNGAELVKHGDQSVLSLGSQDGYFDFSPSFGNLISTLDSFSISTNLYIPESSDIRQAGNFIWTFANSDDMLSAKNGNMFLTATNTRYAISKTGYQSESTVNAQTPMIKGRWVNVTYSQLDQKGYLFVDGELKASGDISIAPKTLGSTSYNYLGRSCYNADNYLENAMYSGFWLYQGAIDKAEIGRLSAGLDGLNQTLDSAVVADALDGVTIPTQDSIRSKIPLPNTTGDGISIAWASSNESVVTADGTIYRPAYGQEAVKVTLTATLTKNNYSASKDIEITVLPAYSDDESTTIDLSKLAIGGNTSNARSQLNLPYQTTEGSRITWSSDASDWINSVGRILKLSPTGQGKKQITLTATATKGDVTKTKDFTIYIAEKEDRAAYLFAYFTGNAPSEEQIHFALSNDGFNYIPLNNGNAVINSADIALKKSVRDPHILRCEDGKTFYMVATDMRSSEGWSSNRGIVMLKSTDLVHWTSATVNFPTKWADQWGNVIRVWAPQTIFDPAAGKYMVYFSLLTSDGKVPYDKIFYCYANADFTDLEGEPRFLFDRGSATIDGDIVFSGADNRYHLFFKNEGVGGISEVTSKTLTPQNGLPGGSQWSVPLDNVDQTDEAVEGAGVFRLINKDEWVLMYDCYGAGHYQFCKSPELKSFNYVMNNYNMNARHGTTISITKEEEARLIKAFPSTALDKLLIGARNNNIRDEGIKIDEATKKLSIPVLYGADLSSFDPEFYATPGAVISPEGAQDFSTGPVSYSFTLNNQTTTFEVSAEIQANPVITGFHADPEVLYSKKTGLFYIYPTTDGYPGWGGYSFDVFSSPDLVNWTNEGTILDLSTNQVSWATGNAWAPCIEEKEVADNQYRYYFYFSGESGSGKKIGVAVSDSPTGPFVDSGQPMISSNPSGVGGQIIDGDVFTDPVSDKSYFYWGNGYMAVAELNDNMTSIKDGTTKILTPHGGSLSTYAYREGSYVFYRKGTYYFMWSVDDTGSPNYHVAYGTSDSPTGPIHVAGNPIVTMQDPANGIYGPGHNSILQIPGKDEWYIVYHRINKNYLNNGPGYHREVCIDRLQFNDDGTIQTIVPTNRGIEPVNVKSGTSTGTSELIFKPEAHHGKVVKSEYYNLAGQQVSLNKIRAPGIGGVFIVVNHFQDGSIESKKIVLLQGR